MPALPVRPLARVLALLALLTPGSRAAVFPAGFSLGLNLPPPFPTALNGAGLNRCPPPAAPLDRLLYDRLTGEGADLSCGNRIEGLLPFPGRQAGNQTPRGAFDELDARLLSTRRELLIQNMLWDDGPDAPGAGLARSIAALRRDVAEHPGRYPGGLTVRILLGNSVRFGDLLDPTANLYSAARHLLLAGVPLTGDTVPGWRLELANYTYAFPHNHVKLIVQDGERVLTGGFNITFHHLPKSAPGGHGQDIADLALAAEGPVARHAAAAFHDGWALSRLLTCRAGVTPETLRRDCSLSQATPRLPLSWTTPAPTAGSAHVYPLYRRNGYTDADDAVTALFGAASATIDVMQSQVSGTLGCVGDVAEQRGCPPERQLPVWRAAAQAVRERGVTLRLILDYDSTLQMETLAFLRGLHTELAPLGLASHVQARWYAGGSGLHTKAALVDGAMLVVGSQNLHHSAFGPLGLAEYSLATSDAGAVAEYRQLFETEWARAHTIRAPWWLPALPFPVPPAR